MRSREPTPLSKAARNERRKLFANTVNAAGLGVFAIGFVQPVFALSFSAQKVAAMANSVLVSYVSHGTARRMLRGLED